MKQGHYPDAFYRVSIKALIVNQAGQVLCVREDDEWTLPGGGIDHGEAAMQALSRELHEEAMITSSFEAAFIGTESFYVQSKDAMAFWLMYEVALNDPEFTYGVGDDADDVAFREPTDFKGSENLFEQFIYKYGVNRAR